LSNLSNTLDEVTIDLLKKLLDFSSKNRITASKALAHPYFSTLPEACRPGELQLLERESHEFLLQIQQGNKFLSSNRINNAIPIKKNTDLSKPCKRHLLTPQNESLLAPSTKESCTTKSFSLLN